MVYNVNGTDFRHLFAQDINVFKIHFAGFVNIHGHLPILRFYLYNDTIKLNENQGLFCVIDKYSEFIFFG